MDIKNLPPLERFPNLLYPSGTAHTNPEVRTWQAQGTTVAYDPDEDLYELDLPPDVPLPAGDAPSALRMAQTWFPQVAAVSLKAISTTGRGYLVEVAEIVDVSDVARDVPAGHCIITAHPPIDADPAQVHSRVFASGIRFDADTAYARVGQDGEGVVCIR
ncbi:hypothetical protein B0H17DRAFT_1193655 [Mycena rosella]|uniref:Uncharacterized protein n=1 Tax=Mycena rosella TaxID=1033263 RepID=A0AAD7M7A9_MYCRO|nr:hypothetical protein B0H17DRAFT_1193655 [Mycena rosella]